MKIYKGKEAIQGLSVDVVDDLTTDSATDALSAKQGKTLNDRLTIVEDDVEEIKETHKGKFITGSVSYTSLPNFNTGKIKANFTKSSGNTDLLSFNANGEVVIGSGIKFVKATYNIRYDWNNALDKVYYAMLWRNGGDDWGTMGAVHQMGSTQYLSSYSNKIYQVSEGDLIGLQIGANEAVPNASAGYYIIVEIIE